MSKTFSILLPAFLFLLLHPLFPLCGQQQAASGGGGGGGGGEAIQKIAIVNMAKVFQDYEKTKVHELRLQKQADVFKEYSMKLTEVLKKAQQEFTELRNASQNIALTEAERQNKLLAAQDKYTEVSLKEKQLREYNRDKQAELRDAYDTMRADILKEIHAVIQNKCMLEGYSLVLDSSGMTLNNIAPVVYWNPGMDITQGVLEELNRGNRINAGNPLVNDGAEKKQDMQNQ